MMFRLLLIFCLGHCLLAVFGVNSGIDAHIGDTVMLPCDGPADTDTKEVDVLWLFGGKPACWFNGNWCETGHYVSRTRLGSIKQNNFCLVIDHVRKEDKGEYMCRINGTDIQSSRLIIDGDGKQEDAEMPPGDPVCRPYREREDPPGSETKDRQDSVKNSSGESSGGNSVVIGVIVGIVGIVVTVGAMVGIAELLKLLMNRQKNQTLT